MEAPRIYLDACCLNRPFDDQSQDRIRLESEAVLLILSKIRTGHITWVGSEVLDYEIGQTSDIARRRKLLLLFGLASQIVPLGAEEEERGLKLESLGFKDMDALHLASAETVQWLVELMDS